MQSWQGIFWLHAAKRSSCSIWLSRSEAIKQHFVLSSCTSCWCSDWFDVYPVVHSDSDLLLRSKHLPWCSLHQTKKNHVFEDIFIHLHPRFLTDQSTRYQLCIWCKMHFCGLLDYRVCTQAKPKLKALKGAPERGLRRLVLPQSICLLWLRAAWQNCP